MLEAGGEAGWPIIRYIDPHLRLTIQPRWAMARKRMLASFRKHDGIRFRTCDQIADQGSMVVLRCSPDSFRNGPYFHAVQFTDIFKYGNRIIENAPDQEPVRATKSQRVLAMCRFECSTAYLMTGAWARRRRIRARRASPPSQTPSRQRCRRTEGNWPPHADPSKRVRWSLDSTKITRHVWFCFHHCGERQR